MGYTHYWKIRRPFTNEAWDAFTEDVRYVFADTTVPLANALGEYGTVPTVNNHSVRFNGVATDGCETCCITKAATDFEFCKTRQRPYDSVVVKVLKLAREHNPYVELSSDGDGVFD